MHTKFLGYLALGLCLTAAAEAAETAPKGPESRVVEATVFRDRASVRRRLSVRLPKGGTTVRFKGVTPLADPESLRAYLSDRSSVTLMGIRTDTELTVHAQNPELERWLEIRKRFERRREDLLGQVALVLQGNQNLEALARHYRESFSLNLHQSAWNKASFESFLKLLAGQGDQFNASWWKLFQDYQKVHEELGFAEAKVRELSRVNDRKRLTIAVDLLADSDTRVDVDIQYLVPRAGWSPAYDIRLDPRAKIATLEQHAFVWQSSGEDWRDVTLNLSNVRSELKPVPPTISPYTLSVREVKKVQTTISSGEDSATSLTVGGSSASDEGDGTGIAKIFKVPGPQTVRDGLARTRVFVAAKSAPFEERLELVAARYPRVFRKVDTRNPFAWDLEAGPAAIYWDGDFLQRMTLDGVAKGNRIGLNAGVESDFQVSRWNRDKTAEPGILDSQRHHQREIGLTLTHFGAQPRTIRVYEQVPVSEIKEVLVKLGDHSPGLREDPMSPSWRYWDLEVTPRKPRTLTMKLDVAVPSSFQFSW